MNPTDEMQINSSEGGTPPWRDDVIVTKTDVRNAIDSLIATLLSQNGRLGDVITNLDEDQIRHAEWWLGNWEDGYPVGPHPAFLIFNALRVERGFWKSLSNDEIVALVDKHSPNLECVDYEPSDGRKVLAYLEKVRRFTPLPHLGRQIEIVRSVGFPEFDWGDRIDLRRFRRDGIDAIYFSGDGPPSLLVDEGLFPIRSAAEIAKTGKGVEYLIPGLLPVGQPGVIGGPEKCLKTSLAIDLGVSLATATPFLGDPQFTPVRPAKFFLASAESGEGRLVNTFNRVCRARGIDPASVDGFTFTTNVPRLDDEYQLNAFERAVADSGAEVVCVDPLGMCLTGDSARTLSSAYQQLHALNKACERAGAQLIVCHHSKQNTDRQKLNPANLAGAGVWAWLRWYVMLGRVGEFNVETGEHVLRWTAGGSSGHSQPERRLHVREGRQDDADGQVWEVGGPDGKPATAVTSQVRDDAAKVLGILDGLSEAKAAREIAKLAGRSVTRTATALAFLACQGQASIHVIAGGNNRTYDRWQSTEKPDVGNRTETAPRPHRDRSPRPHRDQA